MALSNKDRITKGNDLLREALVPFVERELNAHLGQNWQEDAQVKREMRKNRDGSRHWDVQGLLKVIPALWDNVFRYRLGPLEKAVVGELNEFRNRWAHDETFSSDLTLRALDSMQRLLEALGASTQAEEIGKHKTELQRVVFTEQARNQTRYQLSIEGLPKAGLKPWRDVVTPHRDVISGRFMQAEFAADLAQVARNEGSDEYRDPQEFFRRTFITTGLRELLSGALRRLSGQGGDPVVELQTNFGGGKTHSMLALYHLFGGTPTSALPGLEPVLRDAGVRAAETARRAVLVGTNLSPSEPQRKSDGTVTRTLWGELAWQLGGAEGYTFVAESDQHGISPGSEVLLKLFRKFQPCLILIDEWVAYARQIVDLPEGSRSLPGGSFEAQTSFVQALTEAAKSAQMTLVVASIPASKLEAGGKQGEVALETLKNVLERVARPWRPASGDEGFEIVRRRLFEPITERDAFTARDAVVRAFARMYKDAVSDYPQGCSEGAYERELEAAYPLHPELFRRLYEDWATLDKFQRTRGVLRLLARVVHMLWESGDHNLLILPSMVPLADAAVKSELTRYLPDDWESILSQDVDGEGSLPLSLERDNPNLGKVSACRRVTRTLFIGTAPGSQHKNPGVDDRQVRLGCVQPGEPAAVFGDALRRLCDRGKYIHQDQSRYWISTKANLNRVAGDRAVTLLREPERLHEEIVRRLREHARQRGEFTAVHPCPLNAADVDDEPATRLVLLHPQFPHRKGQSDSPALQFVREVIDRKGSSPLYEKNCLLFLAPDRRELDSLLEAVAQHLAWKSMEEDPVLDLAPTQQKQVEKKLHETSDTVDMRLDGAWIHGLVPHQEKPGAPITWDELKLTHKDTSLPMSAAVRFIADQVLYTKMGAEVLRQQLDRFLWQDCDHVSVSELSQWFARYLFLPRIKNKDVLLGALRQEGISGRLAFDIHFALASRFDPNTGRYEGLIVDGRAPAFPGDSTLLVKPEVARRQIDADAAVPKSENTCGPAGAVLAAPQPSDVSQLRLVSLVQAPPAAPVQPRVYIASVRLNGQRVGRDAGRIAEEVLQHLTTLPGAEADISLEVTIRIPNGISDDVTRTVRENAATLKFTTSRFERD